MIDVKLPLRRSYYECLNGNLQYNAVNVPVSDDTKKLGDTSNPYVLLTTQSGSDNSTFQTFDSIEEITIEVIWKQSGRTNKEVIDFIAGQIMNLIQPTRTTLGLTPQTGVEINCVQLVQDRDLSMMLNPSNSMGRRVMVYRQKVRQTGDGTPGPVPQALPIPDFVRSDQFQNPTSYYDPALLNVSYKLFWNDDSIFLERGVNWQYAVGGGFIITLLFFDATTADYVFVIVLN